MDEPDFEFIRLSFLQANRQKPMLLLACDNIRADLLPVIYEALKSLGRVEELDVVLFGNGGEINTTRRIALLLRRFSNRVTFIVPYRCLSAFTLLALSGDEIIAGEMTQFSPVDPILTSADDQNTLQTIHSEDIRCLREVCKEWFRANSDIVQEQVLPKVLDSIFPSTLTSLYRVEKEQLQIAQMMLAQASYLDNQEKQKQIAETLVKGYHSHHFLLTDEELAEQGLNVTDQPDVYSAAWSLAEQLELRIGSRAMKSMEEPLTDAIIGTHKSVWIKQRIAHVPAPQWTRCNAR